AQQPPAREAGRWRGGPDGAGHRRILASAPPGEARTARGHYPGASRPGIGPGSTGTHSRRRRAAMSALDDQRILRQTATRVVDAHGLVLEDVQVRHGGGAPEVRLIVDLPEDRLGSADLDTVAAAS